MSTSSEPRRLRVELPKLYPAQALARSAGKRFNVLQTGRRVGKTLLGIDLVCECGMAGHPAAWFAPTNKFLAEAWRDVCEILALVIVRKDTQEKRLELLGGGSIDFWTMDGENPGRGRKYKLAVVDEAGIVRNLLQVWMAAIRPTLADLRGDAWFLSSPRGRGDLNRLYMKGEQGDPGWHSVRLRTIDNPYIDPQEVHDARIEYERMGLLHIFQQEFEGIPADDGGNPFGLAAIAKCFGLGPALGPPVVFGVDLAKSQDWTVVVGLDAPGNVVSFDRWQGVPWPETRERIMRLVGAIAALVDCTGLGDPIVEEMQRASMAVEGYPFTQKSKQDLMIGLANGIQSTGVRFAHEVMRNELESFEYTYTGGATGNRPAVRYSAPPGLHDDCVCALALAYRHLTMRPTAKVWVAEVKPTALVSFDKLREDKRFGWDDDTDVD